MGAETHGSIEIPPPRHLAELRSKQLDFTHHGANNRGSKSKLPRTTLRSAARTRKRPTSKSQIAESRHAGQDSGSQASPPVPITHGTMYTPHDPIRIPSRGNHESAHEQAERPRSPLNPTRSEALRYRPARMKGPKSGAEQARPRADLGGNQSARGEGKRRGAGALPSRASSRVGRARTRGGGGGIRRGSEARRGKSREGGPGCCCCAACVPSDQSCGDASCFDVVAGFSTALPPVRCGRGWGVGGLPRDGAERPLRASAVVGWRDGRPRLVTRPRDAMSPVGR
jgi:hypothetical protein